jgi:hypothetical protein
MSDNSSFFDKSLNDLKGLEEELLGPDYPYHKMIKSPSELGMSGDGGSIGNNISGLIAYSDLLVSGQSKASVTGRPLGEKFFLKTGAKCKDKQTNQSVPRSLYFNTIPDGSIPFISSGLGKQFTSFEGLIPGTMSDMSRINPLGIFQAFMLGNQPECQALTMPVVDNQNVEKTETAYVLTSDIRNIPPCWFKDGRNPVTNETCKEAFTTLNSKHSSTDTNSNTYATHPEYHHHPLSPEHHKHYLSVYPTALETTSPIKSHKLEEQLDTREQRLLHLYYSSLGILGLYIFMKLWMKQRE